MRGKEKEKRERLFRKLFRDQVEQLSKRSICCTGLGGFVILHRVDTERENMIARFLSTLFSVPTRFRIAERLSLPFLFFLANHSVQLAVIHETKPPPCDLFHFSFIRENIKYAFVVECVCCFEYPQSSRSFFQGRLRSTLASRTSKNNCLTLFYKHNRNACLSKFFTIVLQ